MKLNYKKLARGLGINEQTQETGAIGPDYYKAIIVGLNMESMVIYTATEQNVRNIRRACKELHYKVERLPGEEVRKRFDDRIGLRLTKLEKVVK